MFDGQSQNFSPLPPDAPYPMLAAAGFGQPAVVGIPGTSWSTLAATVASRRDPALRQAARVVHNLTGGHSDLLEGDTAAAAYADMAAYAGTARALCASYGIEYYAIAATLTPSHYFTAPQEAQRAPLNDLIRASGAWEAVVDHAAIPQLQNNLDTTYYYDGSHWTTAGATIAAEALRPLLTVAV